MHIGLPSTVLRNRLGRRCRLRPARRQWQLEALAGRRPYPVRVPRPELPAVHHRFRAPRHPVRRAVATAQASRARLRRFAMPLLRLKWHRRGKGRRQPRHPFHRQQRFSATAAPAMSSRRVRRSRSRPRSGQRPRPGLAPFRVCHCPPRRPFGRTAGRLQTSHAYRPRFARAWNASPARFRRKRLPTRMRRRRRRSSRSPASVPQVLGGELCAREA